MSRPDPPKTRPVRRFRVGFLSAAQVLFAILIFLAVNLISSRQHRPFDLSENLAYTLSPSTKRYLASEALQQREAPVRVTVAFRAESPFYERIRPLAEEYARVAGEAIELRLIDPIHANDSAEAVAAEYGLVFNQDLVVIDARSAAEREAEERRGSPHVRIVKLEDMVVHETDAEGQRRVRGFLGEDALRAGLVAAIEGQPRKLWLLADKSDLTGERTEGIWTVLRATLVSQNIQPDRVQFATLEEIPEDVEALAIVAPAYDFTAEEIERLRHYWNRPAASLLVLTGREPVPPRLRNFLRQLGVTPQADRVITTRGDQVLTRVPARFTSGLEFTRDLWEKTTQLDGYTRSLEVREGAEDLLNRRIQPFSLLESVPSFWGETRYPDEAPEFDPDEDRGGPLPLAAAVIKGNPTDERFAARTSRMVVIGNSDFLAPDNARQANLDLLSSCTNWLVGRESLSGEGPRNLRRYRVPLLPAQASFINRINLLFLPGFFLLLGLMVWSSRRY